MRVFLESRPMFRFEVNLGGGEFNILTGRYLSGFADEFRCLDPVDPEMNIGFQSKSV